MRRGASLRSSPKPLTRGDWPGHDRYALTERRHKVLGLGIAIPLLFANAWLVSLSKSIVQILDEQSTGLLAERLEAKVHA